MRLLNKSSLYKTLDNVNEALFYGKKISKTDAKELISWISTRLDTEYSYNKSFGVTKKDMSQPVYTFTGERLASASMRHIMSEEATRVVLQLSKIAGTKPKFLKSNEERFYKMLKASEEYGRPLGTFCCGPCTVGLWRHLNAGGLPKYQKNISNGLMSLHSNRDETGKWGRFPFFYTLLALLEIDDPLAMKEINYALPECERAFNRLRTGSKFSDRKRELLLRVLN